MVPGLKEPQGLQIDFRPSPKQYEVWQNLQPECPLCGGEVTQKMSGVDRNGNPTFKPVCSKCGNENIPQMILTGGAAGGGKAISINDLVLTPTGFKRMGEISVGDRINTQNGEIASVIAVHPQGKIPLYRLTTNDGIEVKCCANHIWKVVVNNKTLIIDTKHLIEIVNANQSVEIPLCNAQPQQVEYDSFIHPYIIGVLLGDGGTTKNMTITTPDDFIVKKVQSLLPKDAILKPIKSAQYGWLIYNKKTDVHGYPYSPFKNEIIRLGMNCKSLDKHIPSCVMSGDIDVRMACVQGLMDTDGYVDSRGHTSFSVCSKSLAEDFMYLVRSLGAKANMTTSVKSCVYKGVRKCREAYTVWFNAYNKKDFVTLPKKRDRIPDVIKSFRPRTIQSIKYAGEEYAQCITIDHPSGMFITNGFLPTHNSYLGSCWLISSCLRWSDMRMVVGRKTLKSLRESTWNTILSVCKSWGLVENEHFKVNNLSGEMIFWNGSKIIMKEMAYSPSDPSWLRFGSSEYSGGFIDEVGEIEERGVDVLFSRIRWKVHETFKVPKLLMSTNPCLGWVRDRFVIDNNGEPVKCREGELYLPFSVFDNPDVAFRNAYAASLRKINDPTTVERLLYGNWMWVDSNEAAAYWKFDGAKHLVDNLKEKVYNPLKPIILSFDFNVIPFMSCLSLQIDYDNKKVYVLEEILGRPENKDNNTPKLAQKVRTKYLNEQHAGGLFVTGDPAGLARSTQTEDGVNNFTIIMNNLDHPVLRPKKKLLKRQPSQVARLDFVNALFDGYDGWEILIDMRCRKFTEDLIYQKKNADGTKSKAKATDPKLGVKYEKYGHLSDCFDYFLCLFLSESWGRFQSKNSGITTTVTPIYNNFSF